MKITGHCVVRNEDIWVWYALKSVLPFCEQILVYDTGSSDKTVERIKSLSSPKIILEEKGVVDAQGLVDLRKEQIESTQTDWFLVIDGDEIWPEENIKKIIVAANTSSKETVAIFNRVRNCIGDVYHYLPESTGRYKIAGVEGNLNIRLIKKTPDLSIKGRYPLEAYTINGKPIQDFPERLVFVNTWLLHASFLKRSSSESNKTSGSFGRKKFWEKGLILADNEIPKVLLGDNPPFDNTFQLAKRGKVYEFFAGIIDPLLMFKRCLIK